MDNPKRVEDGPSVEIPPGLGEALEEQPGWLIDFNRLQHVVCVVMHEWYTGISK